jgi:hypothetical protein
MKGLIMNVNDALENLYLKGLSRETLAKVTGIHAKDIREARHEPSILSLESRRRCHRLDSILETAMGKSDLALDPVAIFEEHIILGKHQDHSVWAKLCDLWRAERIDDTELAFILENTKDLYSYEVLSLNHPMEYEVIEGGDGYKGILAKLPISRVEGDDLKDFTF